MAKSVQSSGIFVVSEFLVKISENFHLKISGQKIFAGENFWSIGKFSDENLPCCHSFWPGKSPVAARWWAGGRPAGVKIFAVGENFCWLRPVTDNLHKAKPYFQSENFLGKISGKFSEIFWKFLKILGRLTGKPGQLSTFSRLVTAGYKVVFQNWPNGTFWRFLEV